MLQLDALLPLRMAIVTLRFTAPAKLRFFHQPALAAFLRGFTDGSESFERSIRVDTAESGRVEYAVGHCYRFTLAALAGGETLLQHILQGLAALPNSASRFGAKVPFNDNVELLSVHDAFSARAAQCLEDLTPFGVDELNNAVDAWAKVENLSWEFLSPSRLTKPMELRKGLKGEARFCRNGPDVPAGLLLSRVYDALAELLRKHGVVSERRPEPPTMKVNDAHLFWIHADYTDAAGSDHAVGGLLGRLQLAVEKPLPSDWLAALLLSQYTGIGQRPAFGFGRYRLLAKGAPCFRRAPAAHSLLMHAMDENNRSEAFRHILSNLADASADDETRAFDDDALSERVDAMAEKLLAEHYRVPALKGLLLPKTDGGVRPLAVPPLADRILQRAVVQVLSPAIERFLYRHSYGFRPGRSRLQVRYAVQSAWREGYRWVFESDIADFFDSVDWQRLETRLRALFDADPVVDAVMQWVRAPVFFQDRTIDRMGGLPQGSPLSPLLANLMLDDFDGDMETLGFRLVRFADDFVVLCKSPEQAQRAHEAAVASLAEHGLTLQEGKTRITPMDRGFNYLGYLFVNDMALDVGREEAAPNNALPHPRSWLARLSNKSLEPLPAGGKTLRPNQVESSVTAVGEAADEQATLLCVTGDHCVLSTGDGRLRLHRDGAALLEMPWQNVSAIVLFGRHTLTTPAMDSALRYGVPIHMASGMGSYRGILWQGRPTEKGSGLWLRQAERFADTETCLELAKSIVETRMLHMRETLRQRGCPEAAKALNALLPRVAEGESTDSLNGLEGAAARNYFQSIGALLSGDWGFDGRNRRPPRDPFNALLSYGYTLLYGYTATLTIADGLLPWQGFYHREHGRHQTLASDLMEPFRHLVERTALTLLLRRQLTPQDFLWKRDDRCLINKDARKAFLAHLIGRLNGPVKAYGADEAKTPLQHLHEQNLSLIRNIDRKGEFVPWRMR